MSQNKETIAGIVFLIIWIALMVGLGKLQHITPNLNSDGGYEPCEQSGHPLYQGC